MNNGNIYSINGRDWSLPQEMELGTFMEASGILADLVNEEGKVELNIFMKFAKDSQKMKDVVMLLLDPVGKPLEDKWEFLKKITLPQVIEVIQDFFVSSGQLWTASPGVSEKEAATSKRTPSIATEK